MRLLSFQVDGQSIKRVPDCDFTGIAPGTENYIALKFSFSDEWDGTVKVCEFYTAGLYAEPAPIKGEVCVVPSAALKHRLFQFRIVGKRGEYKITTGREEIRQEV